MCEPSVNVPLLRKAVEWAEAEAAKPWELCEWNQRDVKVSPEWITLGNLAKAPECGTCYCIAGYVGAVAAPKGVWGGLSFAQHELGLTDRQADDLFDANNSIKAVRRIAESIAGERL